MNERLQGSNSDRLFLGDYFDVVAAAHEESSRLNSSIGA